MKNIFKTIALGVGILSMSSCSDFLDQTSPSEMNTTTVYNNSYYTKLALNKVYGDLTLDQTYSQYIPIVWGLNSDCELVDGLGETSTSTTNNRGAMNYNVIPGWGDISKLWDSMYKIIENANMIIEGVEGSKLLEVDNAEKMTMLQHKGQALTLRGMIYYDLVKFFGDIPFKIETAKPDLSNAYIGKTDRDEIMDQLILDLEEAIEYLPWAGESDYSTEYATKGYAHSLLANIALSRAGWHIREAAKEGYETADFSDPTYPTQRCDAETRTKMYNLAQKHLSAVITSGVHKLNPSIENHWYLINQRKLDETYRENIFEIPMGLAKSSELGYTVGVRINGASDYYGAKGNSSGKLKLTAPYFYSFEKNDLRRDLTCATYQLKETDKVLKEEMLGNTPFALYCAKWDIRKMTKEWRDAAKSAGEAKCMTGINVVRMRYPQVLLMYAEVVNELSGPDGVGDAGISARDALKEVHKRAFKEANKNTSVQQIDAISSKEDFFSAIVDENAWELAGEGFRKFDLIRWNLLSSKIDDFKTAYKAELDNGTYPEKLYFKYKPDTYEIDMSSVCWYQEPEDKTGYESKDFFGKEKTATTQTQLTENLPLISAGLNATVTNRYLLPIASSSISDSNGTLYNSYGYTN
ncbi:RagB/SusD family nutrient uptake outer membrane protein [Bacteroides sp. 224]|uniref:RagB/SusD family nutrient uptake outer membrane protein n=1 Tax=Bacteroides sp. 224 TaxID=2302936 RepID=UPI0013D2E28A|nr:RagB/SusD family nutrient uptake outer membrane protein [Bacteroides sp. 224]NDV66129.1 RagB/SusD family nutrient uptake outer membrane protein [Bacteroides sp. 224]